MPGVDEFESVVLGNFGDNGTEPSSEFDLGFDEVEFGDGVDGGLDGGELFAERFG